MSPLRRLELRLLRECAQQLEQARRHAKRFLNGWTCSDPFTCPTMARFLTQAASLAAEYRDLRDARRMLVKASHDERCRECTYWPTMLGHAPGCALERVTR